MKWKFIDGFGKEVKDSNLIQDKLGIFEVSSWIDEAKTKPATIIYKAKDGMRIGSPTTRKKTLESERK